MKNSEVVKGKEKYEGLKIYSSTKSPFVETFFAALEFFTVELRS